MGNDPKPDIKPLPFANDLLGISKKTTEIHHNKLYAGYVAKTNEIGEKLAEFALGKKALDGNQTYSELRALRDAETFARNGMYLHEYYFDCLGGNGEIIKNKLTIEIESKWGSVKQFIAYFSSSGMSMRGWVVLCWDMQAKRLKVYGCDAHNQGGVWGCLPIIVLDVYEHAYFIDFGADRKAYIEAFWKNINWQKANELFIKIVRWIILFIIV